MSLPLFASGVAAGVLFAWRQKRVFCSEMHDGLVVPELPPHFRGDGKVSQPWHSPTWGVEWNDAWDRRASASSDGEGTRGGPRQIILVRHGQYRNESNKEVGDEERVLTTLGEAQARATGKFLRAALLDREGSNIFVADTVSRVYVSELTRAKQTAALIAEELFPSGVDGVLEHPDKLLNERFPCDPTPPYPAKRAKRKNIVAAEEAFLKHFHRPACGSQPTVELMVGHGNMIRYFVCRALQLPPEAWLRFAVPHCSVTLLHIRWDGTVKLVAFGSFGHLPPSMQTVANLP